MATWKSDSHHFKCVSMFSKSTRKTPILQKYFQNDLFSWYTKMHIFKDPDDHEQNFKCFCWKKLNFYFRIAILNHDFSSPTIWAMVSWILKICTFVYPRSLLSQPAVLDLGRFMFTKFGSSRSTEIDKNWPHRMYSKTHWNKTICFCRISLCVMHQTGSHFEYRLFMRFHKVLVFMNLSFLSFFVFFRLQLLISWWGSEMDYR